MVRAVLLSDSLLTAKFRQLIRLFLTFVICILIIIDVSAQSDQIKELEKSLNKVFGVDKLKVLNDLSDYYYSENIKKSTRLAKQATVLADNIFQNVENSLNSERIHQIRAYFHYGKILFESEKFLDSKVYLNKVEELSIQFDFNNYLDRTNTYLQDINARIASGEIKETFFSKTIGNLEVGKAINRTSQNLTINTELKIAEANEKNGDFQGAINHYEKAINLLRNQGNKDQIRELQLKVAVLLDSLEQHVEAQKILNEAIAEIEAEETQKDQFSMQDTLEALENNHPSLTKSLQDSIELEKQNLKDLSEKFLSEKNEEKSAEYLKQIQSLTTKLVVDSISAANAQQEQENEISRIRQQKELTDLKVKDAEREAEKQHRRQKTFLLISIIILIGTLTILYFYFAKRREHTKLTIAYDELDKTITKLEEAELRIVTLLKQQVSGDIATELLASTNDQPEKRFVCVMFLDIRDFTPMAENLTPEELIGFQNRVFGFMIDIVQEHHGNINQLLGDGFMATFGAPVSHGNDCQNAFDCAQEIIAELDKKNNSGKIETTKIGIGLHAGFVVTGNVGNDARKQYSVTGNPVILASRVEQLNKKYNSKLVITEEVYLHLENNDIPKVEFIEERVKGRKKPVRILKFE